MPRLSKSRDHASAEELQMSTPLDKCKYGAGGRHAYGNNVAWCRQKEQGAGGEANGLNCASE
jgi:hypothetical protein